MKKEDIRTREELIEYLNENQKTESPFNESLYRHTLEALEMDKKLIDGKKAKDPTFKKNYSTLGEKYFELAQLPKYRDKAKELQQDRLFEGFNPKKGRNTRSIKSLLSGDEAEDELMRELYEKYFYYVTVFEDVEFIKGRVYEYYSTYDFNDAHEKFLIVSAISDELKLRQLNEERQDDDGDTEKIIKDVRSSYMSTLEALKLIRNKDKDKDKVNNLSGYIKLLQEEKLLTGKRVFEPDAMDRLLERTRESVINMGFEDV